MDEFKVPNRRPWLLFAAVLIAAAVLVLRHGAGRRNEAAVPAVPDASSPLPAVVAALPAASTVSPSNPPSSPLSPPRVEAAISTQLLAEAVSMEQQGKFQEARAGYQKILETSLPTQMLSEVETRLGQVNVQLVTTPRPMPEKAEYIVKKGDSVERIARKFGTTVDLARKSNDIGARGVIRSGDRMRVLSGKFSVVVNKSRNDLVLYLNDEFFKRYRVGTGRYDKTPVGTFLVSDKVPEPPWDRADGKRLEYGDPENILGSRWMALRATGETPDMKGYGIHGATNDSGIGKFESAGCVRMRNSDVEELFDFLPVGTPVRIE